MCKLEVMDVWVVGEVRQSCMMHSFLIVLCDQCDILTLLSACVLYLDTVIGWIWTLISHAEK